MVGAGAKGARRTLIAIRTVHDLADQSSSAVGNPKFRVGDSFPRSPAKGSSFSKNRPRRRAHSRLAPRSQFESVSDRGIGGWSRPSCYLNMYPRLRFLASHASSANPAESRLSKNSRRCRAVEPTRPQRRTRVFRAKARTNLFSSLLAFETRSFWWRRVGRLSRWTRSQIDCPGAGGFGLCESFSRRSPRNFLSSMTLVRHHVFD